MCASWLVGWSHWGIVRFGDSFFVTTSLSDYSARRPSHQLLFDAPFARPRTQGCRRPDITHRCCSCRLTSAQQDSPGHSLPLHHGLPTPYLWRQSPVPQGAPHDFLPDTSSPSCSRLRFQSTSKLLWHPWPIFTTWQTFTFVTKFNWSQKPCLIKNQPNTWTT